MCSLGAYTSYQTAITAVKRAHNEIKELTKRPRAPEHATTDLSSSFKARTTNRTFILSKHEEKPPGMTTIEAEEVKTYSSEEREKDRKRMKVLRT